MNNAPGNGWPQPPPGPTLASAPRAHQTESVLLRNHTEARRALPGALVLAMSIGACAPGGGGPSAPGPETGPAPVARPAYVPISPALPPIPRVAGPLAIRVIHPTPDTPRPRVDSTFVYGSVGTGDAALSINGVPVPVAPNGAFVAYLSVPADGRYALVASAGGREASAVAAYAAPVTRPAPQPEADTAAAPAPARTTGTVFPQPLAAVVTGGADTLATGSDVAVGRPTPTGTYRWFLPRGARVSARERRGDMVRVQLDPATTAWLPAASLTLGAPAAPAPVVVGRVATRPGSRWTDVLVPARGAPFRVDAREGTLSVTLHGAAVPAGAPAVSAPPLLLGAAWSEGEGGSARLDLDLAAEPWGYKAFYEPDGTLVLRLRHPPAIDPAQPLRGIRILLDPGHPPAGATGPTGLREAEANLAISLPLAAQLRARGADVHMTRTTDTAVELGDRTEMAVRIDADLLVSVHNNALGEGSSPFRATGTSTYYFHPGSAGLAAALNREIVDVTRIRDIGARQGNLALVRPTWMPSTLTESLFMLIPEQEAALRDPELLERLAAAHLRGIEAFLRGRAAAR